MKTSLNGEEEAEAELSEDKPESTIAYDLEKNDFIRAIGS